MRNGATRDQERGRDVDVECTTPQFERTVLQRRALERIAGGWLAWSTAPDAIFTVTSVEILYRVPGTKG